MATKKATGLDKDIWMGNIIHLFWGALNGSVF